MEDAGNVRGKKPQIPLFYREGYRPFRTPPTDRKHTQGRAEQTEQRRSHHVPVQFSYTQQQNPLQGIVEAPLACLQPLHVDEPGSVGPIPGQNRSQVVYCLV